MIKTILIDDEKSSIKVLNALFKEYFDFIEVIDTATSVKTGKVSILKHNPDLVFLDIKMNDGTGFDLLKSLPFINFKIIFMTAYSEYALKAIKTQALDYLLKPIDVDELTETLLSFKKEFEREKSIQCSYPSKILVPYKNGSIYLEVSKIIRIEAQGSYCKIFVEGKGDYLISNNLKHFEGKMNPNQFFRCHHSHLINLEKVESINNEVGMEVVLTDGSRIDVSRRKKAEFYKAMDINLNS